MAHFYLRNDQKKPNRMMKQQNVSSVINDIYGSIGLPYYARAIKHYNCLIAKFVSFKWASFCPNIALFIRFRYSMQYVHSICKKVFVFQQKILLAVDYNLNTDCYKNSI